MKIVLPCLALLALALAGCKNHAPGYTPTPPTVVEPVKLAEVKTPLALMPLDLGNQWSYTLTVETYKKDKLLGSGDVSVDYRVSTVRPDGSALLILRQDGQSVDQQVWRSTSSGLYQVASGLKSVPYVPQQPLALVPLSPGQKFDWKGRAPEPDAGVGPATMTSVVLAPQNVDTGLGPLSAIPIESVTRYPRSVARSTSWFRPGVGLVRLRQETAKKDGSRQILTLSLDNYALKR